MEMIQAASSSETRTTTSAVVTTGSRTGEHRGTGLR
jgi:hypothetical protein